MLVDTLTTMRSRRDILHGWINGLDAEGRLHGSCFTISTPTGRARHSVIVNVPSAKAAHGKEMRSLFVASPGHKIVGADSAGNQMRALCHYLKNDEFTELILNGDIHQANADILNDVVEKKIDRNVAKPFIYAFLFGGGGEKLGLILTGVRDSRIGNIAKEAFVQRVPGLNDFIQKVLKQYDETQMTGKPYVLGADGRRIYCDSAHKALNYLLQSFEALSCKAALSHFMRVMKERNIPYRPLIWYHDEMEFETPDEYAEVAREVAVDAFREGGKIFNIMILDGAGKIGNDWYEVH
jgi:DNA polymerase I-like protein with 3'-5' exonuclease and polymerase domains